MRKDTLETVPLEELNTTTGGCGGILGSVDQLFGPIVGQLETFAAPVLGQLETLAGPILDIFKPVLPSP